MLISYKQYENSAVVTQCHSRAARPPKQDERNSAVVRVSARWKVDNRSHVTNTTEIDNAAGKMLLQHIRQTILCTRQRRIVQMEGAVVLWGWSFVIFSALDRSMQPWRACKPCSTLPPLSKSQPLCTQQRYVSLSRLYLTPT